MHISIAAIGRMKKGAASDLVEEYSQRARKTGRSIGLNFAGICEFGESRASDPASRMEEEGGRLLSLLDDKSYLISLDERGQSFSSPEFAAHICDLRDSGVAQLVIALGGPDGHSPTVRTRSNLMLSFGRFTWPHQMARILICEQLYRVNTILTRHPYHRQ